MSELIKTICHGREIHLAWNPLREEITPLIRQGFIPIEMSEGAVSYTDNLGLDHHNELSGRPPACISALEHYGHISREEIGHFMVNHTDAD